MADANSFDVASKVDLQEVKNAIDQTLKEIQQRFDFKGTKTDLTLKDKEGELVLISDDDYKLKSVVDILKAKLIKRSVSVKAFAFGTPEPSLGGAVRQTAKIQNGLSPEKAKEIAKGIKDGKFKVQAQIQGDQVRVQSKSRDELQAVIAFLKGKDFGVDLQYLNYR
ncbi:MAG: YajQ family cyclic di-GMP-binding protein [Nitrospirae bacterium]|nr:MAG: YajQ family cyclic di-GMP-binding protein [Nitrospirota bacterium]